jgi:hypothetical protein
MRPLAILPALAFAAACTTGGATAPGAPAEMRVVAQTAYATTERTGALIASDEATYRNTWAQSFGNPGAAPAIDFATETAVFLFGGMRPTGGYSLEVNGVSLENGTLVVDGGVQAPPSGSMTTQSLTYPSAVIAVKSRDIKTVRWNPAQTQ